MCVNYTNLDKAYPKDAHPPPNIDKLGDNSSGLNYYHLWSLSLVQIKCLWPKLTKKK